MRPEVSVVMPFAGERADAQTALLALRSLDAGARDELIVVDNSGADVLADGGLPEDPRSPLVKVVAASGERSPAHARNAGAAVARHEWILFLDADVAPRPDLLAAFFEDRIDERVGAVAGEVLPAPGVGSVAERYGAARSFLGQQAHRDHPYRPRAVAANLLVRKAAFAQLGGFCEGVRAGEDTDFSWRLQEAGWRLELRPQAAVEHRYRRTLPELRRQWRGYAAGRAWLARRYEGFRPEPAAKRAWARVRRHGPKSLFVPDGAAQASRAEEPRGLERGRFAAIDAVLALEELAGFTLSNRPRRGGRPRMAQRHRVPPFGGVDVVLVADRFPARGDPLVELARTIERARVEATARPAVADLAGQPDLVIDYGEDDGAAARWLAAAGLIVRHPLRAAVDLLQRRPDAPPLRALAPAVQRLARDSAARIRPLGAGDQATAERLARLAGRSLDR